MTGYTLLSKMIGVAVALGLYIALTPLVIAQDDMQAADDVPADNAQGAITLPRFNPETGRYMLFDHIITREGANWQAQSRVRRCVRFTAIGRGFRADSYVVSVEETGPKRLVTLLGLTQAMRKDEHLVFDLDAKGHIIGLRDEKASWQNLVRALRELRRDLPALIANPLGRSAGEQLIDRILATAPAQRDAYLAEGFLPVLALHPYMTAQAGLPLQLGDTQETATLLAQDADRVSVAMRALKTASDDVTTGARQSQGRLDISQHDGLLLASERVITTYIGASERRTTEKWERIAARDQDAQAQCTAI